MVKKIILWILVLGCMGMIFSFSAQPANESQSLSDGILYKIIRFFSLDVSGETMEFLSVFIRKAAHFSVYALLGFLLFLTGRKYGMSGKKKIAVPWIFATLYAVTDEIHQIFVLGRSGQIRDVFIDSLGAAAGITAAWLIIIFLRGLKND